MLGYAKTQKPTPPKRLIRVTNTRSKPKPVGVKHCKTRKKCPRGKKVCDCNQTMPVPKH